MLEKNIQVNEKHWKRLGGLAIAKTLEWGKERNIEFRPEIILMTDCVYYEEVNWFFLY